ncbi:NLR family CARD domain-containing protein 3 [Parambassis ranga]|uniref:NLR family CARD domain-containing protein 3 n=1 Tax=Parambassis ranga TaxID=210632 RepID=A0A6P7JHL1_9TELE|nr:NLR family CARD domain-containing protein 3-like [Parambassis ranga]
MDPDNEVESLFRTELDDDEKEKFKRPASSYGSMKSETEEEEGDVLVERVEMEKEGGDQVAPVLPERPTPHATGFQMIRSESPETLYTITTEQTKPPGAFVIDTRSSDLDDFLDDDDVDDEEDEERSTVNSPEPPEPVEPDDAMQTDENRKLGILHPEQDLPYLFKTLQKALTGLNSDELRAFKYSFYQWEQKMTLKQVMEGDLLDFVDKSLEVLGLERTLYHTIRTLENVGKKEEAEQLRNQCKRALIRFQLQHYAFRKYQVIREGVVQAGVGNLLDTVYVEPQISTCGFGGVNPAHEFSQHRPSHLQVPSPDSFVSLNELFRLQKVDGTPVRTVLTTGIPGIGMSVCVGKFSLDWAELRANRDLQFIIKLSFRALWTLRSKNLPPSQKMSVMEMIQYYHPDCKGMPYLEEEHCKFLLILESFDCYQTTLDWKNAEVINDISTQAHPDVLIVNILRGSVLPGAYIWILGRRAAVSQIPSQFIDVVTEIQGFSDEMKDDFLTKRYTDAQLAAKIVAHYKRLPALVTLAHQPFVCWMIASTYERSFRYDDYGVHRPRLTPFYISIMIIQMNRRLQFYYGKTDYNLKWSNEDKLLLHQMGKMAFKMLERNTSVFFEEDVKDNGLKLTEVVVLSGLCTELPSPASDGRRTFCFIHLTVQEFMAAVYVFTTFRTESKNVLDSGVIPRLMSGYQTKSAASLFQSALTRTLNHPLGHYDMFLRFLCGMLGPECHDKELKGILYPHNMPKVAGLEEAEKLLEQSIQTAPADRVENLRECLREMTQEDE